MAPKRKSGVRSESPPSRVIGRAQAKAPARTDKPPSQEDTLAAILKRGNKGAGGPTTTKPAPGGDHDGSTPALEEARPHYPTVEDVMGAVAGAIDPLKQELKVSELTKKQSGLLFRAFVNDDAAAAQKALSRVPSALLKRIPHAKMAALYTLSAQLPPPSQAFIAQTKDDTLATRAMMKNNKIQAALRTDDVERMARDGIALGKEGVNIGKNALMAHRTLHTEIARQRLAATEAAAEESLSKRVRWEPVEEDADFNFSPGRDSDEYSSDSDDVATQLRKANAKIARYEMQASAPRPALHKPPPFTGSKKNTVEQELYVHENYLRNSGIPKHLWCTYMLPLLQDKALEVWLSIVTPAEAAGTPLTWKLFTDTMLTAFSIPNKELTAREKLHSAKQGPNQTAFEYVRFFNSLVQKAGDPTPSSADQMIWFRAGLHPTLHAATAVNPRTGAPWNDLPKLQAYVIALHTHSSTSGTAKHASAKPARLNAAHAQGKAKGDRAPQHKHERSSKGNRSGGGHQDRGQDRKPPGNGAGSSGGYGAGGSGAGNKDPGWYQRVVDKIGIKKPRWDVPAKKDSAEEARRQRMVNDWNLAFKEYAKNTPK